MNKKEKKVKKTAVMTHSHVDADAVFSTICYCIQNNIPINQKHVIFVPAGTKEVPDFVKAIDIQACKHPDGPAAISTFKKMLPKEFIEELEIEDSTGLSKGFPISMLISALRMYGMSDIQIIQYCIPIVMGLMEMKLYDNKADEIIKNAEKIQINNYSFLIIEEDTPPQVGIVANSLGFTGSFYKVDHNWGIYRYPGHDKPDLSKLQLDGWFAHPDGFLFCWGSKKSPASKDPPQFDSFRDFIEFACNEIKTKNL